MNGSRNVKKVPIKREKCTFDAATKPTVVNIFYDSSNFNQTPSQNVNIINNNNNNASNNPPKRKVEQNTDTNKRQKKPFDINDYKGILSDEQLYAVQMALEGHNMLVCGAAGTGKTTLLKTLVRALDSNCKKVALTATTGNAATQIGFTATTLHSWMAGDLCKGPPEKEALKILANETLRNRWQSTNVLILDEVSMLSAAFFAKLEYIARKVRSCPEPFGGLQVILCGDWAQLEPVIINKKNVNGGGDWNPPEYKQMKYCFETPEFKKYITKVIILTTIFRQKGDIKYLKMLEEIRKAEVSLETKKILYSRVGSKLDIPKGMKPTYIFSRRDTVAKMNKEESDKLPGDPLIYTMESKMTPDVDPKEGEFFLKKLRDSLNADKEVELKVGTMVVFLVNILKEGLSNGSQGIVTGFVDTRDPDIGDYKCPLVQFIGKEKPMPVPYWCWEKRVGKGVKGKFSGVYVKQVPLKQAFAITVHRCQGLTLQYIVGDLGSTIFAAGQAYTLLSRVTSLEGLSLLKFDEKSIKFDQRVLEFYKTYSGVKHTSLANNIVPFAENLAETVGISVNDDDDVVDEEQLFEANEEQIKQDPYIVSLDIQKPTDLTQDLGGKEEESPIEEIETKKGNVPDFTFDSDDINEVEPSEIDSVEVINLV